MHSHFLGAHCSIAGGLHLAVHRIEELQGRALQIFTRNQRQWKQKPLEDQEVSDFVQAWRRWGDFPVLAHDSYLINLASPDKEARQRSIQAFGLEVERCARLGITKLVTHPGACKSQGRELGLQTYVRALDQALLDAGHWYTPSTEVQVLLETTAGQGSVLGRSFEELAAIIEASSFADRLGICLDTCHVFVAGYELRDKKAYEQTMRRLDSILGLKRLQAIHVNDSKHGLGSCKDRHEHIGQGEMGLEPFRLLLNDHQLAGIPMVLETPKDKNGKWDRQNLDVLHGVMEVEKGVNDDPRSAVG